jgi:hypothetical protein
MDKRIVTANIKNAFGWRFKNVPKIYKGEFERSEDRLNQLHSDNQNEIIDFEKISFKELIISRVEKGRKVEIVNGTIKLALDYNALTNLFTRLYVSMEIYATIEDNLILLKDEENSQVRLVIWGVMNGKPIYY